MSELRPHNHNLDAGCILIPSLRTILYMGAGNLQELKETLNIYPKRYLLRYKLMYLNCGHLGYNNHV